MSALQGRLAYDFRDPELLEQALAHRSWCAENAGTNSNERLEFLGDAVLGLVVTERLYRDYPCLTEGELAQARAALVNAGALAEVALAVGVGDALLLGKGEDASGGREKPSILSDAMEAVIAAVYIDGGWAAGEALIVEMLGDRIVEAASGPGGHDFKTRLQELAAQKLADTPRYTVEAEGPDHAKQFTATVYLGGVASGRGEGRSKKQAEAAAAAAAWRALAQEERASA